MRMMLYLLLLYLLSGELPSPFSPSFSSSSSYQSISNSSNSIYSPLILSASATYASGSDYNSNSWGYLGRNSASMNQVGVEAYKGGGRRGEERRGGTLSKAHCIVSLGFSFIRWSITFYLYRGWSFREPGVTPVTVSGYPSTRMRLTSGPMSIIMMSSLVFKKKRYGQSELSIIPSQKLR